MPQNSRQEQILALVGQRGFVSIDALSAHFNVTPQTIRRDINQLCAKGLLRRYHGGAGLPSSVENVAYQTRQVRCLEEKRRIAALVAAHVPNEASLFLNVGTTTEEVARALLDHRGLRIITNNLHVVNVVSQQETFEVIVAGGLVSGREQGVVGDATVEFISRFKVDFGIIGIGGIDSDGSLLDFDHRDVRVSQAIIANARQTFLVADHSKFGRNAMARVGNLADMDAFFTDAPPPPPIAALIAQAGVRLHIAEAPEAPVKVAARG